MMLFKSRTWFFLGALFCLGMMLTALYFQLVEDLQPCPLCISQRIMTIAVGLTLLTAGLHNPAARGTRVYAVLGALVAAGGAAISARHVWIQHLPKDEIPECGPGLEYVFQHFPLTETLKLLLNGSGECAEVLWSFLGLSIPGWTLVAFVMLSMLSLAQFWNTQA